MSTQTALEPSQPPAGALSTGSLVGFRLVQALGWRIAAGLLLFLACPLLTVGGYVAREAFAPITCGTMRGGLVVCPSHTDAQFIALCGLVGGLLFCLAAFGLWRRGGRVRDIELLSERVEGR